MAVLQTITLTPMQEQPPVPMRTSDTQEQFNVKTQNLMISWGTNVTIWNNNLTTLNTGLNAALAVMCALPNVERVAQSADNIDRVALSAGNVDTVSAHVSGVDTVAPHVESVDTVAGNIVSVNAAVFNMPAIIDAPNRAQAAAASAAEALASERAAKNSENAAKASETAAATSEANARASEISAAEAAARVTLPVPTQEDDDKAIVWDATGGAWVLSTPPCDPAQMQELEQSVQSMVTAFSTVTAALDRHAQDTAAHPGISVANATAWGGSEKFVSTAAPDGALGKNGDIYIQLI